MAYRTGITINVSKVANSNPNTKTTDIDWKNASKYSGITPNTVVSVPIITGLTRLFAESIMALYAGLPWRISMSI